MARTFNGVICAGFTCFNAEITSLLEFSEKIGHVVGLRDHFYRLSADVDGLSNAHSLMMDTA